MISDLTFLTNEPERKLSTRLNVLLSKSSHFDCLVGYFYLSSFNRIQESLEPCEKIRILIGLKTENKVYKALQQARIQQDFNFRSNEEIIQDYKKDVIEQINSDIKRYVNDYADLWLINTHNGIKEKDIKPINVDDYPAIKNHLDNFYTQLVKRADKGDTPYNLRNCAYMDDFSKQKIVWGEISDRTKFSIEMSGEFLSTDTTTFLIGGSSLLYLVAMLNSKLSEYVFSKIGTTTGVGTIRWKKYTIEQLPIPNLSLYRQKEYEKIVLQLIDCINSNKEFSQHEAEINQMIYVDLKFNQEEIEFIESYSGNQ